MNDLVLPVTRYALSGDVNIAYQTMGNGPIDMVIVPGGWSHVEFMHEMPGHTEVLRRLSTFGRVITFDKRGQGLSDRMSGAPSLEQRMDDVRAIMETVGSQRAALLGFSEGCPMSVLFAATYPERVSHLVLYGGFASGALKLDPRRFEAFEEWLSALVNNWGSGMTVKMLNPSQADNADAVARFAKFERLSTSPGAFKSLFRLNAQIDVTSILPTLRVPTLVLHRRTDALIRVERGRELAAQIPGSKYIEYPNGDHLPTAGDTDALLGVAVHAAARVMAQSQSSEVLVSRVVTDLVAGAGLKFFERGSHELKGLPGRWDLFAASA